MAQSKSWIFPLIAWWIFPLLCNSSPEGKPSFSYGFPMVFPLKPPFSPWFRTNIRSETFRQTSIGWKPHLLGFAHAPEPRSVPGALDRGLRLTVEFLTRRATSDERLICGVGPGCLIWFFLWCIYIYMYGYICIIYVYIYMYACMYVCMYVCMFLKMGDPQVTMVVLILSHGHP